MTTLLIIVFTAIVAFVFNIISMYIKKNELIPTNTQVKTFRQRWGAMIYAIIGTVALMIVYISYCLKHPEIAGVNSVYIQLLCGVIIMFIQIEVFMMMGFADRTSESFRNFIVKLNNLTSENSNKQNEALFEIQKEFYETIKELRERIKALEAKG